MYRFLSSYKHSCTIKNGSFERDKKVLANLL